MALVVLEIVRQVLLVFVLMLLLVLLLFLSLSPSLPLLRLLLLMLLLLFSRAVTGPLTCRGPEPAERVQWDTICCPAEALPSSAGVHHLPAHSTR